MNRLLLTLITLGIGLSGYTQLYLNEASNANGTTVVTADDTSPDWLELFNSGASDINLLGYYLSDNKQELTKWSFPSIDLTAGSFLTVLASGISQTEVIDHFETAVLSNQIWNYFVPSANLTASWKNTPFNTAGWSNGQLGIGFGDGDDVTSLAGPITTIYVRKEFTISDTSKIMNAIFDVDFDDGFVAYLNGVEIARYGLSGNPPNWNALSSDHEAQMYQGGALTTYIIDKELLSVALKNGTNVLAIEVHNANVASSDLSLIPFLSFGFKDDLTYYSGTVHPLFNPAFTTTYLSTNFSITAGGETLYLSDPSGLLLDSLLVPDLEPEMSVGKYTDGISPAKLFTYPTPGASNNGSVAYDGYEATPTILVEGGFFSSSQTVSVQNNSINGGQLRYTLNGQEPKITSQLYTGPITIGTNSVLRVKCFPTVGNLLSSLIASESFLFMADYTLPVVSITTDPVNLYGASGIFDNYLTDWRKPCVIEYFDADGVKQFESRASIKPDGGAGGSRSNPQHSVTIEPAHGLYGEGDPVHYPLIPEKDYIDKYHAFYLRNGSNYWNQYPQKDATFMRMTRSTHANSQAYSPVIAYVNGEYFGVYELREKANENYFEMNYGNNPDSLDLLSISYFYGPSILRTVQGSDTGFYAMEDFVTSYDPNAQDFFDRCHEKLDLYNFTDYIASENWFANKDWIYNNMKIARTRTNGNRWQFFLQDMELGLGGWSAFDANLFDYFRYNNQPNPFWDIYDGLVSNTTYMHYFVNRYADLMNTIFKPAKYHPIVNSMYGELYPEMPAHFAKWTGNVAQGMTDFTNNRNWLLYQLDNRNAVVREQIVTEFGLVEQVDVTLDVEPAGAGYIKISTIIPEALPWTGVYFDGVPVKMTAVANPGYTFVGWEANGVIPVPQLINESITLNIPNDETFTALFEGAPEPTSLTISEIHYNPDPTLDGGNWIELHNFGSTPVNLTGWSVKSKNFWDHYVFEDQTEIPAGGFLVVCHDTSLFTALYPSVSNFTGATGFNWSNKYDSIQLLDPFGNQFLTAVYRDELPYPVCADGWGRTLENKNTNSMLIDSTSWFCGCIAGSPGEAYTPCVEEITISEINYNNANASYNAGDWFEIKNNTALPLDLSNYVFKDKQDNNAFNIANLVLNPGEYHVFGNDLQLFESQHADVENSSGPFNFGLSGNDILRMYNDIGTLIASVVYNKIDPWPLLPATENYTLEFKGTTAYLDPNDPDSWFAGCEGGSPGRAFSPCPELPDGENGFLYPNPTTGEITVVFNNEQNSSNTTQLVVFDMSGRLVHDQEVSSAQSIVSTKMDLRHLRGGMYYLRIVQADILSQLPFIKL